MSPHDFRNQNLELSLGKISSLKQSTTYTIYICRIFLHYIFVFVFQTQDIAIRCIQKNVRKFMGVREWPWWRLLIKITPMLNVHRTENQLKSQTVRRGLKESCCNSAHNTYLYQDQAKCHFFLCVKIICLDVSKLLKDSVFFINLKSMQCVGF